MRRTDRPSDKGGNMALPQLSPEERRKALAKAAEARQARAALKAKIKEGKMSLAEVLRKSADPIVARMKVSSLLESMPGYGKAKAAKIMTDLDISPSRRVQGLGSKQREQLQAKING
jgi:hypothetical protein